LSIEPLDERLECATQLEKQDRSAIQALYPQLMRSSRSFETKTRPERVFEFLSTPRNVLVFNSVGSTVSQSDPPMSTGSWAVLAFGALRARIEYVTYQPGEVAVSISWSGSGTKVGSGTYTYRLEPLMTTGGTRVTVEVDAPSGHWPPFLVRLLRRTTSRRIQQRIETLA
jgi:carbon monoxide dehydrogenase subunit G